MKRFDLHRFRTEKKITQKELADFFGCNQNFISRIENGIRTLPQEKMSLLQSKFGDISAYYAELSERDGTHETRHRVSSEKRQDDFGVEIVRMMNDKQIAPYEWIAERDREIATLNRMIGRLESELEQVKKGRAHKDENAGVAAV